MAGLSGTDIGTAGAAARRGRGRTTAGARYYNVVVVNVLVR